MPDVILVGGELWVACEVGEEVCVFGWCGRGARRGGGRRGKGVEGARDEEEEETRWWGCWEGRSEMRACEDRQGFLLL